MREKTWELFLLLKTIPRCNWEMWEITEVIVLWLLSQAILCYLFQLNKSKCLLCAKHELVASGDKICHLPLRMCMKYKRNHLRHSWLIDKESKRRSEIWSVILKAEEITCAWKNEEECCGNNGRALKTWVKFSQVIMGMRLLVSKKSRLGYLDDNPQRLSR